jgi:hypothetical protein
MNCPIVKVVLKETFDLTSLSCTQQSCTSVSKVFIVFDQNGNQGTMIVNFQSIPSREIYIKGNKFRKFYNFFSKIYNIYSGEVTLYHCGIVISGPCKGAIVCEIVHSPNPYPEACHKKSGLTRVDSDFAFLNIKNCGKDFIACSGGGYQTFSPGLTSFRNI